MNRDRSAIISFLKEHGLKNMNMIYFSEDYGIESLERMGDTVLLRGMSDRRWVYISSHDPDELNLAVSGLKETDRCFAAIEDWMIPSLAHRGQVLWDLPLMRLILRKRTGAHSPERKIKVPVEPLSPKDAPFIYDHSLYKEVTSPAYIRQRIERGPSGCVRLSGNLVAWIMTHDDASIGVMHVLDEYRQKGYARVLTCYLVDQVYRRGRTPYVHIAEANIRAMTLVKRLGFEKDRLLHWLEITPKTALSASLEQEPALSSINTTEER